MRALLVPVKSFREAKNRLAPALSPDERAALARDLATIVVHAAGTLDVFVACDDGEVADWAISNDALVLWTPGLGLSGAVTTGVSYLGSIGFATAIVAHADLPLATDLERFGSDGVVTLAPDWRNDGTNVAAIPADSGFQFAYGQGSFLRHQQEANRLGLDLEVVRDVALASDVDFPSDLHLVANLLSSYQADADNTLE